MKLIITESDDVNYEADEKSLGLQKYFPIESITFIRFRVWNAILKYFLYTRYFDALTIITRYVKASFLLLV